MLVQVSSARVDDVVDVLQRGERVWCKVINIGEDGKVGLSMKHVNQGNGKDLDPNGIALQMDEQRRKKFVPGQKRPIELEAILDTTCTKCGTRGHLASDCFSTPDGKKYELLPEMEKHEEGKTVSAAMNDTNINVREKSSSKRAKKKKKLKKSRQRSDGSSDEDDSDESDAATGADDNGEQTRRSKKSKDSAKKRKRTKKRKRKRSESEDSESPRNQGESKRREGSEKKSKKCKHSRSKHSD